MDLRLAKVLRFGKMKANVGFDLYNLFNSNAASAFETSTTSPPTAPVAPADDRHQPARGAVQRGLHVLNLEVRTEN
jgi:hypothetical protein